MTAHHPQWLSFDNAAEVAHRVVTEITHLASACIARRGRFSLVLAGGTTPEQIYRQLAMTQQQWPQWTLYYGDERCLPVNDPERNSQMVKATGLSTKAGCEHIIPAELGPEEGARRYAETIAHALPFDLVLLGMGEDGHTASLFPGQPLDTTAWTVPVQHAPKPPPERVSLGLRALQACHAMAIIVTGSSKAKALQHWRAGDPLPVAVVAKTAENVRVFTDKAAMS